MRRATVGAFPSRTAAATAAVAVMLLTLTPSNVLSAQSGATSASPPSTISGPTAGVSARAVIDRARALAEAGRNREAKALLDTLVNASLNEPGDLADGLYWRAVLGERAADAERDWKRMVMDVPLSPRVPTALLRLGELEMVRGHPAGARAYLERLLRDYNFADERPKALLWVVRSYFDERDVARGCRTLIALRETDVPDGELRLQASELQLRCRNQGAGVAIAGTATAASKTDVKGAERLVATPGDVAIASTKKGAHGNDDARYGVQIAAYDTRDQANAVVQRMNTRGLSAHVDGDAKPYRVRIGRYVTRKEAESALARLKKQGQKGFVTVLTP